ncbi:Sua5/YciO/YrdC/YwlC family protein [Candidatus Auribacterota bacterium]
MRLHIDMFRFKNIFSQEKEVTQISEIPKSLKEQVDIVIDGGESLIKKASTVIKVAKEKYQILREGSIGQKTIEELWKNGN